MIWSRSWCDGAAWEGYFLPDFLSNCLRWPRSIILFWIVNTNKNKEMSRTQEMSRNQVSLKQWKLEAFIHDNWTRSLNLSACLVNEGIEKREFVSVKVKIEEKNLSQSEVIISQLKLECQGRSGLSRTFIKLEIHLVT